MKTELVTISNLKIGDVIQMADDSFQTIKTIEPAWKGCIWITTDKLTRDGVYYLDTGVYRQVK